MTLATVGAIIAIIGTSFGVLIAIGGLFKQSRTSAEKAFKNGRESRDDEIALLKSQRDDARIERDEFRRDRDRLQVRLDNIQDRRGTT